MRIIYITAGAAGMYCGSCMKDNALAKALISLGHDTLLLPTYTPLTLDEVDQSSSKAPIFLSGINVYLQQKSWLFRYTPRVLDRLFSGRRLLRWVTRFAQQTEYSQLGSLTVSMLRGREGNQQKEVKKLVAWIRSQRPVDVIILTNALLSGIIPALKEELSTPIVTTLQGDDLFLDELPEEFRHVCLELIRQHDALTAGYISTSYDYADHMSQYLQIAREKINVVHPGINLQSWPIQQRHLKTQTKPLTLGYFARLAPEKGFHLALEAFKIFQQKYPTISSRFLYSGWLGAKHQPYVAHHLELVRRAFPQADLQYLPAPDHASKVQFFREIDVMSVPTVFREPKGLYLMEAWAYGIPVVQPGHGSFPELLERSGAGLIVPPHQPEALADGWAQLYHDQELYRKMSQQGCQAVRDYFNDRRMAEETVALLTQYVSPTNPLVVSPQ